MKRPAAILKSKSAKAVLIKGGHGEGKILTDYWMSDEITLVCNHPMDDWVPRHEARGTVAPSHFAGKELQSGISFIFESERIETNNTHGTGCTLASAIASNIALNLPTTEAISAARKHVYKAIQTAPNIGKGHGLLNHLAT